MYFSNFVTTFCCFSCFKCSFHHTLLFHPFANHIWKRFFLTGYLLPFCSLFSIAIIWISKVYITTSKSLSRQSLSEKYSTTWNTMPALYSITFNNQFACSSGLSGFFQDRQNNIRFKLFIDYFSHSDRKWIHRRQIICFIMMFYNLTFKTFQETKGIIFT